MDPSVHTDDDLISLHLSCSLSPAEVALRQFSERCHQLPGNLHLYFFATGIG